MSKSTEDLIRELEAGGVLGTPTAAPVSKASEARPVITSRRPSSLLLLMLAVVLIAVLGSMPIISLALYPFSLFVTLIHESWHALITLATGGSVASIEVSPDLSGQVLSRGGAIPLIASAGYIGASLTGAAILAMPLRLARWVVGGLAAFPLLALVLWHPVSAFTAIWCIVFIAGLGAAAWRLSDRLLGFLQIFLGAEIALNAVRDLTTLIFLSGSGAHMQTDADNMAHALFGPSFLWSLLWTLISVLVLAAALYRVGTGDLKRLRGQ